MPLQPVRIFLPLNGGQSSTHIRCQIIAVGGPDQNTSFAIRASSIPQNHKAYGHVHQLRTLCIALCALCAEGCAPTARHSVPLSIGQSSAASAAFDFKFGPFRLDSVSRLPRTLECLSFQGTRSQPVRLTAIASRILYGRIWVSSLCLARSRVSWSSACPIIKRQLWWAALERALSVQDMATCLQGLRPLGPRLHAALARRKPSVSRPLCPYKSMECSGMWL